MDLVTTNTPKGSPVGALNGIVHLLAVDHGDRAIGLCKRVLRGNVFEQPGATPTCQACIDARDLAAAKAAGFEHRVSAKRKPLGTSPIAGNNTMRYGVVVTCYACLDDRGRSTEIWSSNEPGQRAKAEKIREQHYLEAWREQRPGPERYQAPDGSAFLIAEVEGRYVADQWPSGSHFESPTRAKVVSKIDAAHRVKQAIVPDVAKAGHAEQASATPVAQWTAEPGPTAGSRRWTHPQFEGWSIYDAGQGGELTVYHYGDEPLGFEDMPAAVRYVAETWVENLVPEPSPVVDPARVISDDELKALVAVETIERTLRLAIQVLGKAQDNPDDAERLTRRGMLLLSHAAGEASGRMATAVKDQDLADRIAAESRARFEVIRDDVNRQQKQEMAPHNLSSSALSLLVHLRDKGGRRLEARPAREELAAAGLISADHEHWYITPAGRAATEGLATCEHNVDPHECTHPPLTDAQRAIHARIWGKRHEEVQMARDAGQEPRSSVYLHSLVRRECEAVGITYVGPYAATSENDTSFTAEEREVLTALRISPVYAVGAKASATVRLREYKLIETGPDGLVALTVDGLLVAKAIAGEL